MNAAPYVWNEDGLWGVMDDTLRIRLGKGTGDGLWIGVDAQWSDDRDTLANYTSDDVNNYRAAEITITDDGCLSAFHRQSTASGIDFRTGFTLRVPQAFVKPLRAAIKAASEA